MLFVDEYDLDEEALWGLVRRMVEAGGRDVYLAAPEALDGHMPDHDEDFKRRFVKDFPGIWSTMEDLKARPRLVLTARNVACEYDDRLEDRLDPPTPPLRWDDEFVLHGLTGSGLGWLMWSYPIWLFSSER